MQLRKHQREFKDIIDRIKSGSDIRHIYLHVTPGGGKSAIPIISGELVKTGLADAICWIVPRLTLAYQAETNFADPFFREMLGHNLSIRSSTNETNPCRGQHGFVTTYQAIGVDDKKTALRDFDRKRYILILDEFHHCEEKGVWHKAIDPLVERAQYVIFMTGTLSRGDGKKIAWTPYRNYGEKFLPALSGENVVKYNRSDALGERAILPLRFSLYDGHIEYEKTTGETVSGSLSDQYKDTGDAIYTALNTDFADQLLQEGLDHWGNYRKRHNRSKVIVVTANIAHGKTILGKVKSWGFLAKIAASDDRAAQKTLKEFKTGNLDILVCIAMAYEGFDCKPLTHVIALTHIRSVPWIEQMVARSVRIDPYAGPYETQAGYIFAPDDPLFRRVVDQIKKEQNQLATDSETKGKNTNNGNGEKEQDVIPIGGSITGHREILFGYGDTLSESVIITISDQERALREKIFKHVREFSFRNYYNPKRINAEIKGYAQKPRSDMTLKELRSLLLYVESVYPLDRKSEPMAGISHARGKDKRVPTQATLWKM